VGVSHPIGPALSLDAELSRSSVKDSPNAATMFSVRTVYRLSKRSAIYAMAGQVRNSGTSAVSLSAGGSVGPGMKQTGFAAGVHHEF